MRQKVRELSQRSATPIGRGADGALISAHRKTPCGMPLSARTLTDRGSACHRTPTDTYSTHCPTASCSLIPTKTGPSISMRLCSAWCARHRRSDSRTSTTARTFLPTYQPWQALARAEHARRLRPRKAGTGSRAKCAGPTAPCSSRSASFNRSLLPASAS